MKFIIQKVALKIRKVSQTWFLLSRKPSILRNHTLCERQHEQLIIYLKVNLQRKKNEEQNTEAVKIKCEILIVKEIISGTKIVKDKASVVERSELEAITDGN